MAESAMKPVEIFYSYAYEDENFVREMDRHLSPLLRQGMIQTWDERKISPGVDVQSEVERHFAAADIILIFVSSYYLDSNRHYNDMLRALKRREVGEVVVIPIILRPTDWFKTPLYSIQALPSNSRAVTQWPDRNEAFFDIAQGIRKVVEEIRAKAASEIRWFDEGLELMRRGQYEQALAAYQRATYQEPENADVYIGIGDTLFALSRYDDALVYYERALLLEPSNIAVHLGRGQILSILGRYTEALLAYEQAILLDPLNGNAYLGKGEVLYNLQRYKDALNTYEETIKLYPNSAVAYLGKGDVLYQLEHYDKALAVYEQVIYLQPDNVKAHLAKGDILLHLQKYEQAVAAYDETIRFNRGIANAHLNKGNALLALGQYKEALRAFNQAIQLDPTNALAYAAEAEVFSILGQHKDAATAIEKAESLGLDVTSSLAIRARATLPSARIELVKQFLEKAGFECKSTPNEVGFLAIAKTWQWDQFFPRGLYVRVLFDSPLNQRTVQAIYHDAVKLTDHALVVINRPVETDGWYERNFLRSKTGRERFVCLPLDESFIKESISLNQESEKLQDFISKNLGPGFDPYDSKEAVFGALSFFGRQSLIETMLAGLRKGHRLGLFGLQKMGKSSVLQELQKKAEFPVSYIYLQPDDTLASIYQRIGEGWATNGRAKYLNFHWSMPTLTNDAQPKTSFNEAANALLAYLKTIADAQPLLGIFLDEIQNIIPEEGDERKMELYISLMEHLRGALLETKNFALLVAGVHPVVARYNYFWGKKTNPMHQIIVENFLSPLDQEDCYFMIRSLGQQIDLIYEKDALEVILEMSGSHPYLARQMCSLALKKRTGMHPISIDIVEEVIQECIHNEKISSYFDEWGLWNELSQKGIWGEEIGKANLALLRALAESEQPLSQEQLCSITNKKASQRAFYALRERNIICQDNSGYYKITFGLFREWIREYQLD